MHNKHEMSYEEKDTHGIIQSGINFEKIVSHSVLTDFGLTQEPVTHGKSNAQISVNTVAAAVAAPKIDERNVYILEDI